MTLRQKEFRIAFFDPLRGHRTEYHGIPVAPGDASGLLAWAEETVDAARNAREGRE